jgi:hypothetical protein
VYHFSAFFFFSCVFVQEQTQKCGDVIFRPFDPVTVQLSLDQSNLQHEKIVLKLVHPQVSVISCIFCACEMGSPVWWPGVKNSPNVAHACRKRRLK